MYGKVRQTFIAKELKKKLIVRQKYLPQKKTKKTRTTQKTTTKTGDKTFCHRG